MYLPIHSVNGVMVVGWRNPSRNCLAKSRSWSAMSRNWSATSTNSQKCSTASTNSRNCTTESRIWLTSNSRSSWTNYSRNWWSSASCWHKCCTRSANCRTWCDKNDGSCGICQRWKGRWSSCRRLCFSNFRRILHCWTHWRCLCVCKSTTQSTESILLLYA